MTAPEDTDEFDYIVVGAGSAGCAVAARLSEDPKLRVLLLEAGGEDRSPLLHVPIGFSKVAHSHDFGWPYETEPESGLGGRSIHFPRGKVLGGSSSINAMIHVRGQKEDYDGWATSGCTGWSFEELLPCFRRSENHVLAPSEWHGGDGPIRVTETARHPVSDRFIAAAIRAGLPRNDDFNGPRQAGVGYYHQTVANGRRQSAARYLKAARKRPNFRLIVNAETSGLIFDGLRAIGVETRIDGQPRRFLCRREVVLSAGVVGSAQLLQLAGIGPAEALKQAGVAVRLDRPAVGANLQDHFRVPVAVKLRNTKSWNGEARPLNLAKNLLLYAIRRKGLLALNPVQVGAFAASDPALGRPDLQIHFAPISFSIRNGKRSLSDFPGMTAVVCPLRPMSRGEIRIAGPDISDPPRIRAGYLQNEEDRRLTIKGLRLLRKIFADPSWSDISACERLPGRHLVSDEDLDAFCRAAGDSIHHPVGTCRMGDDPDSVVDPRLCVRGVEGLRVIDASIMPTLVSGNTNAAALMIGEKGADLLRNA